jgi:DNA-binding MarR family transcriptional regulator
LRLTKCSLLTMSMLTVSILTMKYQQVYTNCLSFQLSQASKRITAWYEEQLERLRLTPPAVFVLGVLLDVEQAHPSDIATCLGLERPTVTALLGRMERDGLIQRTVATSNRRHVLVCLTEQGKQVAKQAYPLLIQADQHLDEQLAGQLEPLKQQLRSLNERMNTKMRNPSI